jgi:rare lipoprotein A
MVLDGHAAEGRGLGLRAALLALAAATMAACATGPKPLKVGTEGEPTSRYSPKGTWRPYQVKGVWYYPKAQPNYDEIGIASWYGQQFHNHYTADGEMFDMRLPSAAHKTLPLPSLVEVTNLANNRTIIVRVNDRGPFVDGRLIDLSQAAAAELGFVATGVTRVRVRYVGEAPPPPPQKDGVDSVRQYQASNDPAHAPKAKGFKLPLPSFRGPPLQLAAAAPVLVPPPVTLLPAAPAPAVATPMMARAAAPAVPVLDSDFPPDALPRMAAASPMIQAPLAGLPNTATPSYIAAPQPPTALTDVDSLLADPVPTAPPMAQAAVDPTAAAPQAAAPPTVSLQVQAGVFSSRANAEALAGRLAQAGSPEIQPFERNGQTLYRVVVRGFSSPEQAAAARTQVMGMGVPDARVVGF